jgi:hypothetical protein
MILHPRQRLDDRTALERRAGADRRRRPTPLLCRYTFRGRRRSARRDYEATGVYFDRLAPGIAWAILSIFVFQCLDTWFTLAHLGRGGEELNPIMAYLIEQTPALFVSVKLGFSTVGLLFLALHQSFPYVRKGIATLYVTFLAIVVYHFFLLSHSLSG